MNTDEYANRLFIIFTGPAGSGKSTLTASFGRWLEEAFNYKVTYVNLDPGCEYLPYKPDFDIRSMFTCRDIMIREKIGPNAAMIRASELMLEKIDEIINQIARVSGEIVVVDTPGQMEVFIFHESGPEVIKRLSQMGRVISVFILDAKFARRAADLVVARLMGLSATLRLEIPTIIVLNKSDICSRSDIDKLLIDVDYLSEVLMKEGDGVISDMAAMLTDAISSMSGAIRIVKVSALKMIGFPELYDLIHEAFCTCGDLT
ncbi:MAG: ATP/GTP-binding protein [Candidatus Baldrarchaeia archaeon]